MPKLCRDNADSWRKATADWRLSPVLHRPLSGKPVQPALGTNNVIPQVRISITQNDKYLSQKSRCQMTSRRRNDNEANCCGDISSITAFAEDCILRGGHQLRRSALQPASRSDSKASNPKRQPKRPRNALLLKTQKLQAAHKNRPTSCLLHLSLSPASPPISLSLRVRKLPYLSITPTILTLRTSGSVKTQVL